MRRDTVDEAWRAYFSLDKVLAISKQFNAAMDGWHIDPQETQITFIREYKKLIPLRPELDSELDSRPKVKLIKLSSSTVLTKERERRERKEHRRRRERRLPPAEKIPVPKNRQDMPLYAVADQLELVQKSFKYDVSKMDPPVVTKPNNDYEVDEGDIFIPTLIVTGRPATQLHYAKLSRFVRSLRATGRSVPFLLRNITVEEAEPT